MLQKLGMRLIYGKDREGVVNEPNEQKRKIAKFKESAWKCIYYLSAEILALAVTYNEPWFRETKYFWIGPGDQVWPDQPYK